ncbi:phosphoglycerate mutase [Desulfacinum hydrothermale DSM 13146]|uniref:Phosphoglycerate mutase n=2 Tax=Desulfacinum hydrothermale TaxID=109258 RepID=A0A1W1XKI0_9BACT|nr:phosphoglycerate mutase [Desulfacinum hydrothermale DSM 13146]
MGDTPVASLGGKTPLEAAHTPHMNRLAGMGEMGRVQTIPPGMEPGSDIANMALLGYDPAVYHTGRAPLEAASLGVSLDPHQVAFRCNLVYLEDDGRGGRRMGDHSAGHITTQEARELVNALQEACDGLPLTLHAGVSYRHLLVWDHGDDSLPTTPPHDILGEPSDPYARVYDQVEVLSRFVARAAAILAAHPVNARRVAQGRRPANAVWPWGQGRAPSMPTLQERFGLAGSMISAVDLLKGLGVYAGLEPVEVPGATGYLDTNYQGKVEAALGALEDGDLVFVHVEAPDEASHEGSLEKKIRAIEDFDAKVVGPILRGLEGKGLVHVLVAADHLTPLHVRTHVGDPSLFALFRGRLEASAGPAAKVHFHEKAASQTGLHLSSGPELFERLVGSI